jgi:hypothetical protein
MSEAILYSPICFHGAESEIFNWQGLWLSYIADTQARQDFKCQPISGMHGSYRLTIVNGHKSVTVESEKVTVAVHQLSQPIM